MTDQLEQDLRQLFAERAAVDVPPVPPTLLHGEVAEAHRSRWLWIGLVAAAVVAAVAIPIGIASRGHDDPGPASPPTPSEQRGGDSIDLPYVDGGVLHVGPTEVPTDASSLVASGEQVLVSTGEGDDQTWRRLVGTRLRPMPYLDGRSGVVVSEDGALVAAPARGGRTATLWSTARGELVATIRMATPAAGHDPWLFGFDAQGRLFWQDGVALRMRTAAGAELTVDTGARYFVAFAPDGVVLVDENERAAVASVADDGTVEQRYAVPKSPDGAWDDAGRLAFSNGSRLMVAEPASGTDPVRVPVTEKLEGGLLVQGWNAGQIVVQTWEPGAGSRVLLVDPDTGATRDLVSSPDGAEGAVFPAVRGTGVM